MSRASTKATGARMHPPRERHRAFACTVQAARAITPGMRRITLSAPELTDFQQGAKDEFFALMIPAAYGLRLPESTPEGTPPRALAAMIPEEQRPLLRWYTIRAHRPEAGEVDVDMVLHGEGSSSGPGSSWAAEARPGDIVGFCEGNGIYYPPAGAETQIFFADETALPALAALLESPKPHPDRPAPKPESTHVHIEVPAASEIQPISTETTVHWHVRDDRPPGAALTEALHGMDLPARADYAWVCAEAGTVRTVRRHLVRTLGMPKEKIFFSGYWRRGEART
ncbi:siderophore-interacting protein [Nesterenkonia sp. NBAIMH1]|uniref:siderophore-interacting protein n=1 Tax=Nesterenkonia sp. NBAIMH1 TaxID=2600320 RepID=UPI0011B819BA|nr:siderophore-interacting protein [Nesterenkonia sp. NBAIMH1]